MLNKIVCLSVCLSHSHTAKWNLRMHGVSKSARLGQPNTANCEWVF